MLEFDVNLIGPKAQKNLVDALRYEPGFSLDLIADLALPIGEYDSTQPLNLGQNRWYGRVGAPIVWQLGPWVPGRRTTLELLPAVWLFGNNDDYVGQTLSTDPMFQVDAHLTRDFTEHFWGSLDGAWYTGGKATIDGVAGREAQQPGHRVHARLPDQRQPRPHRRLQVDRQRQRLPATSRWTGSWSRWWRGGTRSSKARDG